MKYGADMSYRFAYCRNEPPFEFKSSRQAVRPFFSSLLHFCTLKSFTPTRINLLTYISDNTCTPPHVHQSIISHFELHRLCFPDLLGQHSLDHGLPVPGLAALVHAPCPTARSVLDSTIVLHHFFTGLPITSAFRVLLDNVTFRSSCVFLLFELARCYCPLKSIESKVITFCCRSFVPLTQVRFQRFLHFGFSGTKFVYKYQCGYEPTATLRFQL